MELREALARERERLVSIRVDSELYRRVKMVAAAREESIKEVVTRAFEEYIGHELLKNSPR